MLRRLVLMKHVTDVIYVCARAGVSCYTLLHLMGAKGIRHREGVEGCSSTKMNILNTVLLPSSQCVGLSFVF